MRTTDNTWNGGLDYKDTSDEARSRLQLVERVHFVSDVETLRAGSTGPLPHDLEYTLRHVPNHYRALSSYALWELRNQAASRARYRSADCYFQRAIAFRSGDPQLRAIYGAFLHRSGKLGEATVEYETAEKMGLNSAEFYYNRGLLEVDRGNLELARAYAAQAYSLGYPLPGLKNKLEKAARGAD